MTPHPLTPAEQARDLAAAIREGCKLRPRKCVATYFSGDDGACAMGAALVARGASPTSADHLADALAFWPACATGGFPSVGALNDRFTYTREEIADRLDAWADAQEPRAVQA